MDTATEMNCIAGVDIRCARMARMAGLGGTSLAVGSSGTRLMTGAVLAKFILADREICRAGFALEKYWPFLASVESPASAKSSMRTAALAIHSLAIWVSGNRRADCGSWFIGGCSRELALRKKATISVVGLSQNYTFYYIVGGILKARRMPAPINSLVTRRR